MDNSSIIKAGAKGAKLRTRRNVLGAILTTSGGLVATTVGASFLDKKGTPSIHTERHKMTPKAFVYTEVQINVPFKDAPWRQVNEAIRQQPGFINKTWLAGVSTNSIGGIYTFDSIENAQKFVTGYFPSEAGGFGAAHNTRIFDAEIVKEASLGLNSPHFGVAPQKRPGAFVYTEVQVNLPFDKAPWQERNPILKGQKGLIAKTWLSGLHTHTIGGIDAFDTLENAKEFALNVFPKTARKLNAAFYTRLFDGSQTEEASREMYSPFYI